MCFVQIEPFLGSMSLMHVFLHNNSWRLIQNVLLNFIIKTTNTYTAVSMSYNTCFWLYIVVVAVVVVVVVRLRSYVIVWRQQHWPMIVEML